jgi:Flp pilus assembly protein protease CpaA
MLISLSISFLYSNIVLIYCMYRDFKYRKISNKILIIFLLTGSLLAFTEDVGVILSNFTFLLIKIWFLFLVFLFSFMLFGLKVIGGADGKLLIMVALLNPIHKFNFQWIFSFFFVFLFLYLLLLFFIYLFNSNLTKNSSYNMILGLNENLKPSHKIFIILFYKFLDYSRIRKYTDEKFILKSLNLYFSHKKEKFQILTQFRPPLVILILFTNIYIFLN